MVDGHSRFDTSQIEMALNECAKGVDMKLSIIIPAYNEAQRIVKTLAAYAAFFESRSQQCTTEFIVVLNGCTDNSLAVVGQLRDRYSNIVIIDLPQAGKGLAIKAGFADALTRDNDLIGFVDADMATQPQYFYDLVKNVGNADGIIASRYMPGAHVEPPRPWIKRWGSRIFYESLIRLLFGLRYYDFQCGAKLFKRHVIECVIAHLTVRQWAFDVELLFLCKKAGFNIKEVPTTWVDQAGSKLKLSAGLRMLTSLFAVRFRHMSDTLSA